jgi:hypothetical protein
MPAREFLLVAQIDCRDVLKDGPIAGITEERGHLFPRPASPEEAGDALEVGATPPTNPDETTTDQPQEPDDGGDIVGCVASTQAAVREAVRRATIENLDEMLGDGGARLVFVRP